MYNRFLLKINAEENYVASTLPFFFGYILVHLCEDSFLNFFTKQSAQCIL